MKTTCWLIIGLVLLVCRSQGQGTFFFANTSAPTRLGEPAGALAGPGIWAQMLVGTNTDSLIPVGIAVQHIGNGYAYGGIVTVPGIPGNTLAYLQMAGWNGDLWGSSLASVPAEQIGRTDIVPLELTWPFQPALPPRFTQGAVVPIPEPSTWELLALGAAGLWFVRRRRR